jgi:hypothetical protein
MISTYYLITIIIGLTLIFTVIIVGIVFGNKTRLQKSQERMLLIEKGLYQPEVAESRPRLLAGLILTATGIALLASSYLFRIAIPKQVWPLALTVSFIIIAIGFAYLIFYLLSTVNS